MKYVMTFEKYQTYSDYKSGRGMWGSPEDLKADAILALKRVLPTFDEKWIDSVEDQSVEDKGIKFEFKVGNDIIHMLKVGNWRGQWEFYLNKKKMDSNEIQDALEKKHMSELDQFMKYAGSYDFYADYIDNGRQYNDALASNAEIKRMFDKLGSSDKKKAVKELLKKFKNDDRVKTVFQA